MQHVWLKRWGSTVSSSHKILEWGSAVGFLFAPVSYEIVRSGYTTLKKFDFEGINQLLQTMSAEAHAIVEKGALGSELVETRTAFMRYKGQGHEIEVEIPNRPLTGADLESLAEAYDSAYQAQFQRSVPAFTIEIMNWSVTVSTKVVSKPVTSEQYVRGQKAAPLHQKTQKVYFGQDVGELETPVYYRDRLELGEQIDGPALIVEAQTTTLITPDFSAVVDGMGNIIVENVGRQLAGVDVEQNHQQAGVLQANQIELQIMWNRLLALVEEQGQVLIRTAFSPIVRECGDISAGVFDLQGRMLAQAVTGTPGHINTMAEGVKYMLDYFPVEEMQPGDVYMTNDPVVSGRASQRFLPRSADFLR